MRQHKIRAKVKRKFILWGCKNKARVKYLSAITGGRARGPGGAGKKVTFPSGGGSNFFVCICIAPTSIVTCRTERYWEEEKCGCV